MKHTKITYGLCEDCGRKNNTKYKCCRHCGGVITDSRTKPRAIAEMATKLHTKSKKKAKTESEVGKASLITYTPHPSNHAHKRRVRITRATPEWLTEAQKKEMSDLREQVRRLNKRSNTQYHTDHIIPLAGKNVCGLHVPWNLRIVKEGVNRKKGNKILVNTWDENS